MIHTKLLSGARSSCLFPHCWDVRSGKIFIDSRENRRARSHARQRRSRVRDFIFRWLLFLMICCEMNARRRKRGRKVCEADCECLKIVESVCLVVTTRRAQSASIHSERNNMWSIREAIYRSATPRYRLMTVLMRFLALVTLRWLICVFPINKR